MACINRITTKYPVSLFTAHAHLLHSDYTIEYGMFNLMTIFIESIGGVDNIHA